MFNVWYRFYRLYWNRLHAPLEVDYIEHLELDRVSVDYIGVVVELGEAAAAGIAAAVVLEAVVGIVVVVVVVVVVDTVGNLSLVLAAAAADIAAVAVDLDRLDSDASAVVDYVVDLDRHSDQHGVETLDLDALVGIVGLVLDNILEAYLDVVAATLFD